MFFSHFLSAVNCNAFFQRFCFHQKFPASLHQTLLWSYLWDVDCLNASKWWVHSRSIETLLFTQKVRYILFRKKCLHRNLSTSNFYPLKSEATISTDSSASADSLGYLQRRILILFPSDVVPILFFTTPRLSSQDGQTRRKRVGE